MKRPCWFLVVSVVFVCVCAEVTPAAWSTPAPSVDEASNAAADASQDATITIPGPLRSFLRMAGISQKVSLDEVLPFLARNVFLRGYSGQGSSSRPTEFLLLLRRYTQQARELSSLAGPEGTLHVSGCADAGRVLQVLGYRTRPDCGQGGTYVETADPQRAFLTIDSGFPLPELEKTLQGGPAFAYAFPNFQVPVLLTEREWLLASERNNGDGKDAPG